MKKVSLIRASWLNNPVGPSRTLNRIINNRDFFLNEGFDIKVITLDNIIPRNFNEGIKKTSFKSRIIDLVKNFAKASHFLTKKVIEKTLFRYGKIVSDYYISLHRESDIIVFHDFFSCYAYLTSNSVSTAKTVLFYHNNGATFEALTFYHPKLKGSKYEKELLVREKYVLSKIDRVVFIAEYGQKNFQSIHPDFDKKKCVFFHNGIDDLPLNENLDLQKVDNPKYQLCCAGTINERKGQRIIIEAMVQLSEDKLSDFQLKLYGTGPLLPELKKIVNDRNLSQRIIFEGSVDNKLMPLKLSENNIFILMSYEEGLPISIIEAMRSGLPVISTRVSGIPEQVETGYNGIILDPSVEQLVDLFNNMEKYNWKKMGKNSRDKFLEKFTFSKMMSSYTKMLKEVSA